MTASPYSITCSCSFTYSIVGSLPSFLSLSGNTFTSNTHSMTDRDNSPHTITITGDCEGTISN